MLSEVKRLAPQKDVKLKIYAPPERKVSESIPLLDILTDRVGLVAVLNVDRWQYSGRLEYF